LFSCLSLSAFRRITLTPLHLDEQAQDTHKVIRDFLAKRVSQAVADQTRISACFSYVSSPFSLPELMRSLLEQSTVDPSRPTTLLSSLSALTSCVSFASCRLLPFFPVTVPLSTLRFSICRAVLTLLSLTGRCPRRWCLPQALFRRGALPTSFSPLSSCPDLLLPSLPSDRTDHPPRRVLVQVQVGQALNSSLPYTDGFRGEAGGIQMNKDAHKTSESTEVEAAN
jgi:hypothetical protein